MFGPVRARPHRRAFAFAGITLSALLFSIAPAGADDGYDLPFAQAVRSATASLRLLFWAVDDGYVQSTEYVARVGVVYTNHDRFNPPDLAHPTVLVFDQAGRLVACEYQFVTGTRAPAAFRDVPAEAWYDIPRHVHYNIRVDGKTYYEQEEWPSQDVPTEEALKKRGLMPQNGTLSFAFVHPKTRSFIVWAWLPNEDGLFAGENALMPER